MRLSTSSAVGALTFVAALSSGIERATATNPGFMPGDCCFVTSLSEGDLIAMEAAKSMIFSYRLPQWYFGAMCGYSGYWRLEYTDIPQPVISSLRKVYDEIREYSPQELIVRKDKDAGTVEMEESNPLRILIVNGDYDVKRFGVVSKFNENWVAEFRTPRPVRNDGPSIFGGGGMGGQRRPDDASDDDVLFVPIVKDVDQMMREWRDAAEVAPLDVALPCELSKTIGVPSTKDPLRPKSPLKFVILTDEFESYVSPEDYTDLYVVSEAETTHLTFNRYKNGWRTDAELKEDQLNGEFEDLEEEDSTSAAKETW